MELGSARRLLGAIAGGMRWLLNLRHEASAAVEGGGAATSKVASGIMGAARHAKQKADAQCVGSAAGGGFAHDRTGRTPKALLHMWRNRLEAAQRHRGEGADVFACTDPVLFHHKIRCIHDIRTWHSEGSSAIAWSAIVRKCRAEMPTVCMWWRNERLLLAGVGTEDWRDATISLKGETHRWRVR